MRVLVCNNDIVLRPDTYRRLVDEGESAGFVTAVGVDDPKKIEQLEVPNPASKRPHPDFSCYLIHEWVYDLVGPFDEKFKGAFYEDNCYHVRMHRNGITAYSMDLPFLHVGGGSQTVKQADEATQREIADNGRLNGEYFVKKYGCHPRDLDEYAKLFTDESRKWHIYARHLTPITDEGRRD